MGDYIAESVTTVFSSEVTKPACINISILDDSIGEPLESFTVHFQPNDPRVTIRGSNSIDITIQDNDGMYLIKVCIHCIHDH